MSKNRIAEVALPKTNQVPKNERITPIPTTHNEGENITEKAKQTQERIIDIKKQKTEPRRDIFIKIPGKITEENANKIEARHNPMEYICFLTIKKSSEK